MLSWPSPSYYDQLHYMTLNGPGARQAERMGAQKSMGSFSGLVVVEAGQSEPRVTFFRDASWTRRVTYTRLDSSVISTTFEESTLGLKVRQLDFVPDTRAILIRHYEITKDPSSNVGRAWLISYSNLSPSLSKIAEVPFGDFLLDHKNDFVAVWDEDRDEIVQFHPADTGVVTGLVEATRIIPRRFGALGDLLKAPRIDEQALSQLVRNLDESYAPGVYALVSTIPAPDQFQVGLDETDSCAQIDEWSDRILALADELPEDRVLPADPGTVDLIRCNDWDPVQSVVEEEMWSWTATSAYSDLLDGELSMSPLAGAQVNTALRIPLTFDASDARATIYFAFSDTHSSAKTVMDEVKAQDPEVLLTETEALHRAHVAALPLPTTFDDNVRSMAMRTFLNLRVGTDRQTGAIVASVARQPSYQLDWPRDGAFFNAALDIAGYTDLVSKRLRFYADLMRTEEVVPTLLLDRPVPGWPTCRDCERYPPNSWEMNYYADGVVGGNVRLEIDNTALLVWSFVSHVGYLEESERAAYMDEIWPTVKAATDFLADWRDPATGLVWLANEDDGHDFTQGLQGAVTVFGALQSASKMARALGEDEDASRWTARAAELEEAALTHLYREDRGFLVHLEGSGIPAGPSNMRAPAWVAWPSRMLPGDDPRVVKQLEQDMAREISFVRGEGPGAGYTTKVAISAALVLADGPAREQSRELVETFGEEIAEPGTFHLGEVFLNVDEDGDGVTDRRVNAVSTPHLWASTLHYLAAMAHDSPELFDRHLQVLSEDEAAEDGCNCASTRRTSAHWIAFALIILLGARRR